MCYINNLLNLDQMGFAYLFEKLAHVNQLLKPKLFLQTSRKMLTVILL